MKTETSHVSEWIPPAGTEGTSEVSGQALCEEMPAPSAPTISIPLEYYERQQEDRDRLMQGLMMYRFKFEELDRRLRLLPGPPEAIHEEIREKEEVAETVRLELAQTQQQLQDESEAKAEALFQAQRILDDAREKYHHYEQSLEELREQLEAEQLMKNILKIEWENLRKKMEIENNLPWWKKLHRIFRK
jgi:hypothetical protein